MRARAPVRALVLLSALLLAWPQALPAHASGHASPPSRPAPPASASSSDPACGESSFTKNGSHWGRTFRWRFAARTTPAGMNRDAVGAALKRAVSNITGSHNDCGLADQVGASASYRGHTRHKPNITTDSQCGKPDGRSVIGFGALRPSDLGLTCYWTRNGKTVEADIKLNSQTFDWYVKEPALCVAKFSVEAVATHETGHAFGLDHVNEATDGHLTMSPLISPCQASEKSLGLGDVKGLRSLY
jgi:Matrixin